MKRTPWKKWRPRRSDREPIIRLFQAMHIGLVTLELFIPDAQSLKEKRFVVRSVKDRLRKFNVSVAECGHQDLWQRSTLGIVSISSDHLVLEQTLNAVVEETEKIVNGSLSYQIDYL